jgi:anti-sigma regulatory factor (Ser/Thr protein kinase)
LKVPRVLSLKDNYDATLKLIEDIRSYALEGYHPVDLFFDDVEYLEPAALTVLTAEIHRCRNLRKVNGKPAVSGYYPSNAEIYRQLHEIGFFRLLEIKDSHPPLEDKGAARTRLVLPFLTDAVVTAERSAWFIDQLAALIEDAVPMDAKSKRYLQGAIVEAMKNAGEHAYKLKPQYQALGHRWWLTGAFDLERREVAILLFDQGVGIPATLEPDLRDKLESVTRAEGVTPRDSLMIEIATRPGESSTGQSGRGQGFKTMRKFVDFCDDGDLIVYSNNGNYLYARAGTARNDRTLSLGGTLIQWRFRHSEPVMVAA